MRVDCIPLSAAMLTHPLPEIYSICNVFYFLFDRCSRIEIIDLTPSKFFSRFAAVVMPQPHLTLIPAFQIR